MIPHKVRILWRTLLAAAALSAGCAAGAQTVTVVMADGTARKFNADYVSDLYLTKTLAPPERLTEVDFEVYGSGSNFLMMLRGDDGLDVVLDVYGPSGVVFLTPGRYKVAASQGNFTIDPGRYTRIRLAGSAIEHTVESGEMAVSRLGGDYTIRLDLILSTGERLRALYEGTLPKFSPVIAGVLTEACYSELPQPAGQFCITLTGESPMMDVGLTLTAPSDATLLPEGEYAYTAVPEGEYEITPASFINLYNPTSLNRFSAGTVRVSTADGEYRFEIAMTLGDGRTTALTYKGALAGAPQSTTPEEPEQPDKVRPHSGKIQ